VQLPLYPATPDALTTGALKQFQTGEHAKKVALFLESRYATAVFFGNALTQLGRSKDRSRLHPRRRFPFFLFILTKSLDLFAKYRKNPVRTLIYGLEGSIERNKFQTAPYETNKQ